MYTSGVALDNINQVFVRGKATFEINSQANATQNVGVIEVSEGGKINIYQKTGSFDFTPKVAYWPFKDMQGTQEESQEGYIHMPTSVECVNGTDTQAKYVMTTEAGHFSLQSTAKGMYNISSNIQGSEDSLVVNGIARVIAANGYSQTFMGYTDYVIEEGTEVTIELLPDYGYQYASGGLNGISTMPEAGKATYNFIMPDNHIHLSAIFERSEDIINVNSEDIKNASITVTSNEIKGNVKFTIDDKIPTSTEKQEIDSVSNGMSVGTVLDLKLSEEIAKNGSKSDTWSTNITELNEEVNIELKVGEDLAGYESYKIVRIHNGETELINAKYNSSTGVLSFSTDRFSTYAVLHSGKQIISKFVSHNNANIPISITADEGTLPADSKISVEVISTTTQSKVYDLIKDAVGDIGTKFIPLNITLKDASGNEIQPNGKLSITIKIPAGYTNPIVCYINSNGEVTKLKTTIKDGYCTFEVDHLSYYVLVEQQEISKDGSGISSKSPENIGNQQAVNTGDVSPVAPMIVVSTLSLSSAISLGYYKKKNKK